MIRAGAAWLLAVLTAACLSAQAGSLEAHVTTAAGSALEDTAVVLEPLSGAALSARPPATAIEQHGREFAPYSISISISIVKPSRWSDLLVAIFGRSRPGGRSNKNSPLV